MEAELKCPACGRFYSNPVILPCRHNVCMACALRLQQVESACGGRVERCLGMGGVGAALSRRDSSSGVSVAFSDADKLSVCSETDSGVSSIGSSGGSGGSGSSRPPSYASSYGVVTTAPGSVDTAPAAADCRYALACPSCRKVAALGEDGASRLARNRALEAIVDKYQADRAPPSFGAPCQACGDGGGGAAPRADAIVMCEQCDAFYCAICRDDRHSPRGPFAAHTLVPIADCRSVLRSKARARESRCARHADETLTMYCAVCREPICYVCVQQGQHLNHDVQALGAVSKLKKADLATAVQSLSEKAKGGSAFLQQLKSMIEQVETAAMAHRESVMLQCNAIIEKVEQKRLELLQVIEHDRVQRAAALKDQVGHCSAHFQKTTGLLQFTVEALKEQDSLSFMQICDGLQQRVGSADLVYHREMEMRPRVSPNFHVLLDNRAVLHEIDTMNFFQLRVPSPPTFVAEECIAHNNKITLVWRQPSESHVVEGYVLEIDDGAAGNFREVYCGPQTVCHVDGLHFNSLYTARVRCYNQQGESLTSEAIRLRTSEVAWFNFERERHSDVVLSEDKLTATCSTFDDRVVLGTIGFSRGVHYWEYRIDRYDNHPDPAFGVARIEVTKNIQLGKDDMAWSMYADDQRTWFMHAGEHMQRFEGGVSKGTVIGVKLDLNAGTISFFMNGSVHGPPVAFDGLRGVFFPAASLNRNVQLTLRTGLTAPLVAETAASEASLTGLVRQE